MVGHQPEEFNVTHGKQSSSALRWTLGFFILLIWGALTAYIGYLSAETVFTKAVIDELSEVDEAVEKFVIEEIDNSFDEVSEKGDGPLFETVVVYTREGLLSDADRSTIEQRLINPMIDYNRDQMVVGNASQIVSLDIKVLTAGEVPGYRFSYKAIFADGGYVGSVIHDDDFGDVAWWEPVCFGECAYSDEFSEKYPEIVNQ